MTQTQFLLLIVALIPLANCLFALLFVGSNKMLNFVNKLAPVLALANLIGFYASKNYGETITVFEAAHNISLAFSLNKTALMFLFFLNFLWLIFIFYIQRFLQISRTKNIETFQLFLSAIIACVSLIILSCSMIGILFFYNCLTILCYFFAIKFLQKQDSKFFGFFTASLYLETIFLFLATVATHKLGGQINFATIPLDSQNFADGKQNLLLILYLAGLFLSLLFPIYLFSKNINIESFAIYLLFLLAYAFSSLYIFIKILTFTFGLNNFASMVSGIWQVFFEIIFAANILILSTFLILSRGLKSSFFYLFFHQFLFALFSIFIFAMFDASKIYLAISSFFLSLTLIFICFSNLTLYLSRAENKNFERIFYDLKITSSLLVFGVANLLGIVPAVGALNSFFLLKILLQKKMWFSAAIFLLNFLALIIFSYRLFTPLFNRPMPKTVDEIVERQQEKKPEADEQLAKNIDFDSSLILTALLVAIAMFALLIIFPFFHL